MTNSNLTPEQVAANAAKAEAIAKYAAMKATTVQPTADVLAARQAAAKAKNPNLVF
jgi:hypothetical protein